MKTLAHQHSKVVYRPVYLSGLKPLVALYKRTGAMLDTGFGLPLVQAIQGHEVLGFSSVSISEEGNMVVRYFGHAGFDSDTIRQELERRGQQELELTFGKVRDVAAVQAQITRLIGWLNNCN